MPTYNYIILERSNHSGDKWFTAIQYTPSLTKGDTIEYALDGSIDKQNGPVTTQFRYQLRVPCDTPPNNYGDYADLLAFFRLANSNLTPSDVIILTDHFGTAYDVYFVGNMSPEPLTTVLEGPNAWFLINITFQVIGTH